MSATVGVENQTGSAGTAAIPGSPMLTATQFPAPGTIIMFTPVHCGDCNQDGVVSVVDSLVAAQHQVGLTSLSGLTFAQCNVTGIQGGTSAPGADVSVLDALAIAQYTIGATTSLACVP
jgi:hypothetical protein